MAEATPTEAPTAAPPRRGGLLGFFASGPDAPPLADPAEVRRRYERHRTSVFLSVTLGYGIFYTCRVNLSVAKPGMLAEGVVNAAQLGWIGSAMLVAYGFGRFANGFLSDRVNIRRFMTAFLAVSAGINLVFGSVSAFPLLIALWGLNGFFQSGGSAPSVVSLSQWFAFRERGTRYGIFSISHALGEGLTFAATGALVAALGWRWGFWGPAALAALTAVVLSRTLSDRPQTHGLPPVWEYKGEPTPVRTRDASIGRLQLDVLAHPAVWIVGLASATMYVARYGIDHWGPLYLQVARGYSVQQAGFYAAVVPLASIAGSVLAGLISDRLFASRRQPVVLLYSLANIGALLALHLVPPGHRLVDVALLLAAGFGIGGLTALLGGLWAIDFVSRRAAGAAMGIVGIFSYLGAAIQDAVSGHLIEAAKVMVDGKPFYPPESFDSALRFWIGSSVVSLLLACSAWKLKPRE